MSESDPSASELISLVRAAEITKRPYSSLYFDFRAQKLGGRYIEGRIFTTRQALREYLGERALRDGSGG